MYVHNATNYFYIELGIMYKFYKKCQFYPMHKYKLHK